MVRVVISWRNCLLTSLNLTNFPLEHLQQACKISSDCPHMEMSSWDCRSGWCIGLLHWSQPYLILSDKGSESVLLGGNLFPPVCFLSLLPPQVMPVNGISWSEEAVEWFHTMVHNRTLYARLYPRGCEVTVELFLEKGKIGSMRCITTESKVLMRLVVVEVYGAIMECCCVPFPLTVPAWTLVIVFQEGCIVVSETVPEWTCKM